MATRSRTSFQKRQKEIQRLERQREKTAKRMQRKQGIKDEAPGTDQDIEIAESDLPADADVPNDVQPGAVD
jgi:hypothetical protein